MIPSISLTDGAYAFLRNSDVMAQAFRPYIYQAYLGNMPVDSALEEAARITQMLLAE